MCELYEHGPCSMNSQTKRQTRDETREDERISGVRRTESDPSGSILVLSYYQIEIAERW